MARMDRALRKIASDETTLVVSHGGVMRLWLMEILGRTVPLIKNGSIYIADLTDRFRVVVTDYLTEATHEKAVLGGLAEIILLQGRHENEVIERGADADACICFHDMELTAVSLPKLTRCKAIVPVHHAGSSYWEMSSWDRLRIPKPFSRGLVIVAAWIGVYGLVYLVPRWS